MADPGGWMLNSDNFQDNFATLNHQNDTEKSDIADLDGKLQLVSSFAMFNA